MRIADEIHESLGAMLSAAKFNFEVVKSNIPELGKEKNIFFEDGVNKVDTAINKIREIVKDAVPISMVLGLNKSIINLI